MRGFILGVLCTLLVGSFFWYLSARHDTVDTCVALQRDLTEAVIESIEDEVQETIESKAVGRLARALLEPVAEPVVANEVKRDIADLNWFQCAVELVRVDLLGEREQRVAEIRRRLSRP